MTMKKREIKKESAPAGDLEILTGIIALLILFAMGFANAAVSAKGCFGDGGTLARTKLVPASVTPQKSNPSQLVSSIKTVASLASGALSEAEGALAGMVKLVPEAVSGPELSPGHTSVTRFEPADSESGMADMLVRFESNFAVFVKLADHAVDLLEMYEKENKARLYGPAQPIMARALLFRVKAIAQNLAGAKAGVNHAWSAQDFLHFANGSEERRLCGAEGCFESPKAGVFGNKSVRKTLLQSDPMNQLKTLVAYLSQENLGEVLRRDSYKEKQSKTLEKPTGRLTWNEHCQPDI